MTGRVVSTGNALVDVVATVPHLPERGSDVLAAGGRLEVGGGGYRALVAARAAGAEALFAGRIGTGPLGTSCGPRCGPQACRLPCHPCRAATPASC